MTGREPTEIQRAEACYDAALARWRDASCGHDDAANPLHLECSPCDDYWQACEAFTLAARQWVAREAVRAFVLGETRERFIACEATCLTCGQAFNPNDDADLIHLVTTVPRGVKWGDPMTYPPAMRRPLPAGLVADYTEPMPEDGPDRYCGGRGEISGYWR